MRLKRWLFTAAMCLCLVVLLGAVKFFQIRAAIAFGESFPEPSETVVAKQIEPELWQATINVVGTARAQQELSIRNELGGRIESVAFASGAQVQRGDLLVQLDISSEQAELDAIVPEVARLQADAKRYAGLKDTRAASRQQVEQVNADLAVAKARANNIRAAIIKKTIIAPFNGRTGLHLLEPGEFLAANSMVTHLVGDTSTLRVDFSMPQRYSNLNVGTPIIVSDDQLNNMSFDAIVSAVEPNISMSTRTISARAQLNNANLLLKPGSMLNVEVPIGQPQTVFILPSTAVRKDTFGDFVFILERDKNKALRAKRQPVNVIKQEGRQTIISSGLSLGVLVATKGAFKLREGLLTYQAETGAEALEDVQEPEPTEPLDSESEQSASILSEPEISEILEPIEKTSIEDQEALQ